MRLGFRISARLEGSCARPLLRRSGVGGDTVDINKVPMMFRWLRAFGSKTVSVNLASSASLTTKDLLNEVSANRRPLFQRMPAPQANPDDLVGKKGLRIYGEMRRDDAVKAALSLKWHAVLSTGWDVEPASTSPQDVQIADFVKANFELMKGTLDENLFQIMSAMVWGYSVSELVLQKLDKGDFAGKIGLKAIKTRLPHDFRFVVDAHDNLVEDGIEQFGKRLPAYKFVVYSFNGDGGNLYGTSDLRACYEPWWIKSNTRKWWALFLDRYSVPLAEGTYPRNGGIPDSAIGDLRTILDRLQAATSIVHPDDIMLKFPTTGISAQGASIFERAIQNADMAIARALLVPSLLGVSAQGDTGSFGQAKKHFDVFILIIEKLQRELSEAVMGEQIIRRIVDLNYTVEEYPKFVFLPFTESDKSALLPLWYEAVSSGSVKSRPEDELHIRQITEFPEIDLEDIQAESPSFGPEANEPGTAEAKKPGMTDADLVALIEQTMAEGVSANA